MSAAEDQLFYHLKVMKVAPPEREHRFAAIHVGLEPGIRDRLKRARLKDWRFDFAWPERMLAVEVEGGGGAGRHTTAKGFREDMVKYHSAMDLGWTIYRCDKALVNSGAAAKLIEKLLRDDPHGKDRSSDN